MALLKMWDEGAYQGRPLGRPWSPLRRRGRRMKVILVIVTLLAILTTTLVVGCDNSKEPNFGKDGPKIYQKAEGRSIDSPSKLPGFAKGQLQPLKRGFKDVFRPR